MNNVQDDIGVVVAKLRDPNATNVNVPYYMYGHPMAVAKEIILKEQGLDKRKYPLFILALDTPEGNSKGVIRYSLNIAIVNLTEKEKLTANRFADVIKPILEPLYDQFFVALRNSGLFFWPNIGALPEHTAIKRPYWGVESKDGNKANYFKDPLDAIEIVNLKINQLKTC